LNRNERRSDGNEGKAIEKRKKKEGGVREREIRRRRERKIKRVSEEKRKLSC